MFMEEKGERKNSLHAITSQMDAKRERRKLRMAYSYFQKGKKKRVGSALTKGRKGKKGKRRRES